MISDDDDFVDSFYPEPVSMVPIVSNKKAKKPKEKVPKVTKSFPFPMDTTLAGAANLTFQPFPVNRCAIFSQTLLKAIIKSFIKKTRMKSYAVSHSSPCREGLANTHPLGLCTLVPLALISGPFRPNPLSLLYKSVLYTYSSSTI